MIRLVPETDAPAPRSEHAPVSVPDDNEPLHPAVAAMPAAWL